MRKESTNSIVERGEFFSLNFLPDNINIHETMIFIKPYYVSFVKKIKYLMKKETVCYKQERKLIR